MITSSEDFLKPEGACGKEAYFFIQTPCIIPEENKTMRLVKGFILSVTAIAIYVFSINSLLNLKSEQKENYIDWDLKTVTAGDYTVELDIKEKSYQHFLQVFYDASNPMPEVMQFRMFLKDELETRIKAMNDPKHDISIAMITFAYNNKQVIEWLRERGAHIKSENWDKLKEVNQKIRKSIKEDKEFLDNL